MFGVARPVGLERDEAGLERDEAHARLLFAAFAPAARLAVEAGVAFDTARDVLVTSLIQAASARFSDLSELAVALDRTPRSVRMLLKNPDPCVERRGINLLERAQDLIDEAPRTADELSAHLPVLEGFDSGRVALAALLRHGLVEPIAQRTGPTRYQRVGAPRPEVAPAEATGHLSGLRRHLNAVGQALSRRGTQTDQVRARPADMEAFQAELEAFVQGRLAELEARAGADAVECTVYVGASPTAA